MFGGPNLSRSDLSSFLLSLFKYGQGVSWGGQSVCFSMLCSAKYGSQSEAGVVSCL